MSAIHNPQKIPAEKIPEGMRILEEDELYETPNKLNYDLYAYVLFSDIISKGWYGGAGAITYFTKLSKEDLKYKSVKNHL